MTETTADPRAAVIARIEAERAWWRDLVAEIGEDRMTEPGPMGDWTFKDLASHLLGWRERTIARLEAAAAGRGEPPNPWPAELGDEEDDPINDWIHERTRDRPLTDVLEDVDRSYERLANAVAALPDELVTSPDAFPWLDGEALADVELFGHLHDEHEPALRAWLDGHG
jgi:Mycothiol maleylpyruvate isomerase N-terminal domain